MTHGQELSCYANPAASPVCSFARARVPRLTFALNRICTAHPACQLENRRSTIERRYWKSVGQPEWGRARAWHQATGARPRSTTREFDESIGPRKALRTSKQKSNFVNSSIFGDKCPHSGSRRVPLFPEATPGITPRRVPLFPEATPGITLERVIPATPGITLERVAIE